MKQHPDSQPRGAVAVNSSDHDDGNADQQFESTWVDVNPRLLPKAASIATVGLCCFLQSSADDADKKRAPELKGAPRDSDLSEKS